MAKEGGDAKSMEEFYQDNSGIIYNADCREVLKTMPDNSVDAIITDPPYE